MGKGRAKSEDRKQTKRTELHTRFINKRARERERERERERAREREREN